jgi:hypothetical protein
LHKYVELQKTPRKNLCKKNSLDFRNTAH